MATIGKSDIRYIKIEKVLLVALCINLVGWGLKFLWGHWTHSISMQADALHSLLDALSSVLGFVGVFMAAQPPDANHPYGHSKFETMAAIGVAVFIFIGCFEIVGQSITRFQNGTTPDITPTAFMIMLASMTASGLLSRWEARMGSGLSSDVLMADALHTRSDLYASLAVMISFIAGTLGYPIIDPIAGLAIAGVIGYAGVRIVIDNTKILTDTSQIDPNAVEAFVMTIDGVLACHAVRTHGSRNQIYMDMHLHVAPEMKMEMAHKLAHQVEAEIKNQFKTVTEVAVHLEPHLPNLEND